MIPPPPTSPKKPYRSPVLTYLGSVRDMTGGGGSLLGRTCLSTSES